MKSRIFQGIAMPDDDYALVEIGVGSGVYACVDAEDYARLINLNWSLTPDGYAQATYGRRSVMMHRLVMNCFDRALVVDHKTGIRLLNRKCFLRVATKAQNNMNRAANYGSQSGIRGVEMDRKLNVWRVTIDGEHVGYFKKSDLRGAILARIEAEAKRYGEWARSHQVDYFKNSGLTDPHKF